MLPMTDQNHFVGIVYRRNNHYYFGLPLSTSPVHFKPHYENPWAYLYIREWDDYVRICFAWDADTKQVAKVVEWIAQTFYKDTVNLGMVN